MKISFVIPAYNEEAYLGKCLSALQRAIEQQPCDAEIIVVNNASTDRTKKIAQSFPNILIIDEPRKGTGYARQAGLQSANGDLIAGLDADTEIPRDWIQTVQYEFGHDHQLVGLSGPYIMNELSRVGQWQVHLFYRLGYAISAINQVLFHNGAMLEGGNFVVRKSALDKIGGYNTSISFYGDDSDLARRLQSEGRVKFSFHLSMPTSARRLKKEGILTSGIKYAVNHFWVMFRKQPFSETHQDIR